MESELERRAARLAAARRRLAELSPAPVDPGLQSEIEPIHQEVEALERQLAGAHIPALAIRLRKKLAVAQAAERALLATHGYDSWLGLQLSRIDQLIHEAPAEDLEAAELEHRRALASYEELAGTNSAHSGSPARASSIRSCPTGWSASPI
jgi:hypothetical protein